MLSRKDITVATVAKLLEDQAGAELVPKEVKNGLSLAELYKNCCAIANAGGGNIVLGLSHKTPRKVVGTTACSKPREVERQIAAALKPAIKVEIAEIKHPQGRVVVVMVPSRAKGGAVSHNGVFYTRDGGLLAAMTFDEISRVASEARTHWLDEICISNLTPMEVVGLLDTYGFYRMLRTTSPSQQDLVMKDLASAGILAPSQAKKQPFDYPNGSAAAGRENRTIPGRNRP